MFAFVLSTSAFAYEMSDPMQNYTLELMIVKTCSSDRGGIVIAQVETATAIIISCWRCFGVSFSVPAIFAAVCLVEWLLSGAHTKMKGGEKACGGGERVVCSFCALFQSALSCRTEHFSSRARSSALVAALPERKTRAKIIVTTLMMASAKELRVTLINWNYVHRVSASAICFRFEKLHF